MKVLLLNGSPRKAGCTFTALSEIASVLEANGIEAEIIRRGAALGLERQQFFNHRET